MTFHDAHNHLQHQRLAPHLEGALRDLGGLPFGYAVVNGTQEEDWPRVAHLAHAHPWILPSFGLHPWYVASRSDDWLHVLEQYLEEMPLAAVGEIGLDRWIEGHDLAVQFPIFTAQWQLAHRLQRAVTVHCIRAWGALWEAVQSAEPLPRGFLLHAYGGPEEMVSGFLRHGAYFSFSPYFLHERKALQRDIFRDLPLDRILVETDAPDMAPPREWAQFVIDDAEGQFVNHPGNIALAYRALAELRGIPLEALAEAVETNFRRLFMPSL